LPILHRVFSRGDRKVTFFGLSVIFLYEMTELPKVKSAGPSAHPGYDELRTRILKGIDLAIEDDRSMAKIESLKDREALRVYTLLPDATADRISRSNREIQDHLLGQFDLMERYRRLQKRRSRR
jgi:hypothetical protein